MTETYDGYTALKELRSSVAAGVKALADRRGGKNAASTVEAFDKKLEAIQIGTATLPGRGSSTATWHGSIAHTCRSSRRWPQEYRDDVGLWEISMRRSRSARLSRSRSDAVEDRETDGRAPQ
jgi:hypothetical protein